MAAALGAGAGGVFALVAQRSPVGQVGSITGLVGADYARLRVGVDRPPSYDPDVVAGYVLDRFGAKARPALPAIRGAKMKLKDFVADFLNRMVEYVPSHIEAARS